METSEIKDVDAWLEDAIEAIRKIRMSGMPPQPRDSIDRPVMQANRHKFRPPLDFGFDAGLEPYVHAVKHLLTVYNHSTLQRFSNPLKVSGLKHEARTSSGSQVRYFAFGRNNFMMKVPVILDSSVDPSQGTQKYSVAIMDGEATYSLEEWIRSLPPLAPVPLGEAGFRLLHQWHHSRRYHYGPVKTFNDMPREIKADILLHMIGAVRPLSSQITVDLQKFSLTLGDVHGDPVVGDSRFKEILVPSLRPRITAINFGLLTLNKEAHDLVMPILRTQTIKSFDVSSCLNWIVNYAPQHRPLFLTNMTRVQLALTDFAYMFFFRVKLPGIDMTELHKKTTPQYGNAEILRQLPNLKYLELWFNSPLNPSACSPWYATREAARMAGSPFNVLRFPCRKTMVDYILTAAFPYIQHIPRLNITGYVKTSTREHWLEIYRDNKKLSRANQLAKVEQRLEEIRYLGPEQMPPPCFCRTSCYYPDLIEIDHDYYKERRRQKKKYPKKILPPDPAKEAVKRYRFDFDDDFTAEDKAKVFETEKFPRYFRNIPHDSVVDYKAPSFRRYRD